MAERKRGECCSIVCELGVEDVAGRVEVLAALADPTRLQIVAALVGRGEEVCICDVAGSFGLSQATASHHMAKLKEAGLVVGEKRGVWVHYSLAPEMPTAAFALVSAAAQA